MKQTRIVILGSVELAASCVKYRSDGIMHLAIKDEMVVTEEDIREMNAAVERLGGGQQFPNLITVGKYTSITKEARDFAATDEANRFTVADAYVLHSFHQRILANFFLKFNKPKLPVKFFDDEESALMWLKQYTAK